MKNIIITISYIASLLIFISVGHTQAPGNAVSSGQPEEKTEIAFPFMYEGKRYYFFPNVKAQWREDDPNFKTTLYREEFGHMIQSDPAVTAKTIRKGTENASIHYRIPMDSETFELVMNLDIKGGEVEFRDYQVDRIMGEGETERRENIKAPGLEDLHAFSKEKFIESIGTAYDISEPMSTSQRDIDDLSSKARKSTRTRIPRREQAQESECNATDILGPMHLRAVQNRQQWLQEIINIIHRPGDSYFYLGADHVSFERALDAPPDPLVESPFQGLHMEMRTREEREGDESIQVPEIVLSQGEELSRIVTLQPAQYNSNNLLFRGFMSNDFEYKGKNYFILWHHEEPGTFEIHERPGRAFYYQAPHGESSPVWEQHLSYWEGKGLR